MKLPSLEDYEIAIDTEQLIKAAELKGGHPEKHNDELVRYVGGFCVVFPFCTLMKKYAVRCWFVNVSFASETLTNQHLTAYFDEEVCRKMLVC